MSADATPSIRSRVYEVGIALQALVVAYGVLTQEEASLWLALAVAIYGLVALILARRNVERAPDARRAIVED